MGMNGFKDKPSLSGVLYIEMQGHPPKMPWAKMVCQNAAPAECLFITWLLLHEKLATWENMQKYGIYVESTCCLCERADETLNHMFFECGFVQEVWSEVAEWCGMGRQVQKWEMEKPIMLAHCTNNNRRQRLYRCMVAIISYHIWRERNGRRMQGKKTCAGEVIKKCKLMLALCRQNDRKLQTIHF